MAERPPLPSWLRPPAARAGLLVLVAGWAGFEAYNGQMMWAALFGAAAVYGVYELFFRLPKP